MDNRLFKLSELQNQKPALLDAAAVNKFIGIHTKKVENIKNLIGDFPSENEIFFLWTLKSFNSFTFIPYIIKYAGAITNLTFTTYGINARIVNSLTRWFDKGEIKNIHIVIAESIKYRMPKVVDLMESIFKQRKNIKVDYVWNHSKISLVKTSNHHFVIEGSGNFSENAAFEQYVFLNNKNIYDFRIKNIQDSIK